MIHHHTDGAERPVVVMVVEDEPLVRMVMDDVLTEVGYRVLEAPNADDALILLEARTDVRVVVTDVEMPGSQNGFTLARLIRHRWPEIGIVICSARVHPGEGDMPPGARFLQKPVRPSTLISAVRELVEEQAPNIVADRLVLPPDTLVTVELPVRLDLPPQRASITVAADQAICTEIEDEALGNRFDVKRAEDIAVSEELLPLVAEPAAAPAAEAEVSHGEEMMIITPGTIPEE